MSDSGQGEGQRSWWEKPDTEPAAQDPYRAPAGSPAGDDVHDPYRSAPPADAPTQAHPTAPAAPTEGIPQHGQHGQPSSWSSPQAGPEGPQFPGYPTPGYQNQQYPDQQQHPSQQQYPNQQYGGQYGNQYGGYGYEQRPPVAGMAHAVLWTAVGGLVLMFTGLGWVASIVALALTPGARREITESGGAKRGLGFLLAGKICAWVNIGLTVLLVIGVAIIIGIASSGGFDTTSTFDSNGLNTLYVH